MFKLRGKIAVTALFLCATFHQINAGSESCPVTAITGTTIEEIVKAQRSTISAVLATPGLKPSAAWKKFSNIVQEMSNGNDQSQLQVSGLAIMLISSYLLYLNQKPNGCSVAELINATVSCGRDHINQPLHLAVQDIGLFVTQLMKQMELNAVSASGCQGGGGGTSSSVLTEPQVCHNDGFSYYLEEIWQQSGSEMPDNLKKVVEEMYAGIDPLDKISALLTTYAILPVVKKVFENWNILESIEMVDLQYSKPIPSNCCSARLSKIAALQSSSNSQKEQFIQPEINFYSSPASCSA